MRITAPAPRSACLLAAALLLGACAPGAPDPDDVVDAPASAESAGTAPVDPTAARTATPATGPTFDAPCTPAQDAAAPSTDTATPPRTHAFAEREDIRACVTFRPQGEGGRHTPVYSGYRPDVRFVGTDGGTVATHPCALRFDAEGAVAPGSLVAARLACGRPVELEDGSAFVLVEGGREVGSGRVVLPPT